MMKKNASRLRKELLVKIREKNESPFSDFSRLARFITGRSVGIVFGGGGARGITQVDLSRENVLFRPIFFRLRS